MNANIIKIQSFDKMKYDLIFFFIKWSDFIITVTYVLMDNF